MLTVYPSNKMEDLVHLLKAVQVYRDDQKTSSADSLKGVLSPDTILVESKGMQHWLNLELAKIQGVSMNYQFQMPGSFIWELARTLLGNEVPGQSPYRREILSWRIDALMSDIKFTQNPICSQAYQYWAGDTEHPDPLKRFQLATRLGDLFEQYMLFRPDWLDQWEQNKSIENNAGIDKETEQWQAWLWRLLVLEEPCHPVRLQKKAIEAIADYSGHQLPRQIMIFAINTMAPQTLDLFNALSAQGQCNIHVFYLNPSVEFWGDVQSDKAMACQMREQKIKLWLDEDLSQISNSLLANLGQQGKEFFNLLQEVKGYEISAFDEGTHQDSVSKQSETVLSLIQQDILILKDPEQTKIPGKDDQSIVISSSHSELREIQALHDYLLHLFNKNPDWKPQDVVVMCPAIEDYAPYIEAVFRSPWDKDESDKQPRLPCSIADRTLMNAEPLIGTFIDLLQLPDSRFEVSKIMDYLRLPALQVKFGFDNSEMDTIEWWLDEAAIHWAKDAAHKGQLAGLKETTAMFTWQWGLERLLLGFAQSDSQVIYDDRLLLPHVEGQGAMLLGRLMQLLERLQYHASELKKSRTAEDWQSYLIELSEQFFEFQKEEQAVADLIRKVINDLAENTAQAKYSTQIDYVVMRNYLQLHFSLPDTGNHFLTGQITFCSMVPMRSIPFKVVAVLGLNDGQFPRQNTPMSFDLMTQTERRKGDRSRRGDDRYLFLEALISARNNLYLSYQGRDIRKNSERQPSLVLKELMNYLQEFYGWKSPIAQPLHPFSKKCYLGEGASFDPNWERIIYPGNARNNAIELPPLELDNKSIQLEQLIRFFDNPLKVFCHERLKLKFEHYDQAIEDSEPFSTNGLTDYQIRDEFCQTLLEGHSLEVSRLSHQLSGHLPESPITDSSLDAWEDEARLFSQAILNKGNTISKTVEVSVGDIHIQAELNWLKEGEELLLWRPTSRKSKDDMRLWLTHLLANMMSVNGVETQGLFFNKKTKKVESVVLTPISEADKARAYLENLVNIWKKGLCQPLLIHAELGKALVESQEDRESIDGLSVNSKQKSAWNNAIQSNNYKFGLDSDNYFNWFYPDTPELTPMIQKKLFDTYQALYENLRS